MTSNEVTLEIALEAFWAKVVELHPEREDRNLPYPETYDLENYARNAVDTWLEINKPVFYVQRTVVQVVKIIGAMTPEEAEEEASGIQDAVWYDKSLDTSYEYLTLDQSGKCY